MTKAATKSYNKKRPRKTSKQLEDKQPKKTYGCLNNKKKACKSTLPLKSRVDKYLTLFDWDPDKLLSSDGDLTVVDKKGEVAGMESETDEMDLT